MLSVSPSCTSTSSGWSPSSSATIWANVVSWPWPCDLTLSLRTALPVGWIRSSAPSFIRRPAIWYSEPLPAPTTSVNEAMPMPISLPSLRASSCSLRSSA